MSCDYGWFITVDFLYWYGRENGTSYASKTKTIQTGTEGDTTDPVYTAISSELEYVSGKWDPGVRVGIGMVDECDGWDLYLYWTYYHNKEKDSTKVSPFTSVFAEADGFALVNPWVNVAVADTLGVFEQVSAEWEFNFNSIDFEIGRRYWLSKCFTMRPFLGIRAIWTETDFDLVSIRTNESMDPNNAAQNHADYNYKDSFRNNDWAVGITGGFQPTWFFTPCFSLYGNLDIALLWGNKGMKKTENYTVVSRQNLSGDLSGTQVNYNYTTSKSQYGDMQPMLDLAIGLRWEDYYCQRRYHFTIDLGWEHHLLFDHNFRFKTDGNNGATLASDSLVQGFQGYDETSHNVSFGGLVIGATFGF